ncbi:MAG: hypothetical protein ABII39_03630 [Candidatus Micrarchaeota archaeon]
MKKKYLKRHGNGEGVYGGFSIVDSDKTTCEKFGSQDSCGACNGCLYDEVPELIPDDAFMVVETADIETGEIEYLTLKEVVEAVEGYYFNKTNLGNRDEIRVTATIIE